MGGSKSLPHFSAQAHEQSPAQMFRRKPGLCRNQRLCCDPAVSLPCPQGCRGVWWLSAPSAGSGQEAEPLPELPQQSWHRTTTTFQPHFHRQINPLLENYSETRSTFLCE